VQLADVEIDQVDQDLPALRGSICADRLGEPAPELFNIHSITASRRGAQSISQRLAPGIRTRSAGFRVPGDGGDRPYPGKELAAEHRQVASRLASAACAFGPIPSRLE